MSKRKESEALISFLRELSSLTQRYGFSIVGSVEFDGWMRYPELRGNGVFLELIYDETRQVYDVG